MKIKLKIFFVNIFLNFFYFSSSATERRVELRQLKTPLTIPGFKAPRIADIEISSSISPKLSKSFEIDKDKNGLVARSKILQFDALIENNIDSFVFPQFKPKIEQEAKIRV